MDLKTRKSIFGVLSSLSIGATALAYASYEKEETKRKKYYVVALDYKNLYIYEIDDIYDDDGSYHFFASDGKNYVIDSNRCMITDNKEVAKQVYSLFSCKDNIEVTWVGLENKKRNNRRINRF